MRIDRDLVGYTRISTVPTHLLGPVFGWTARPFFAAGPEAATRPAVDLEDDR